MNWEILSSNQKLPWSFDLIKEFEDYWDFGHLYYNKGLSANPAIPWSSEIINEFREVWNCSILSGCDYLSWEYELIKTFEDRWSWHELCTNESIPWGAWFY